MLYLKSAILKLSFLNPKDLCLPNQFSGGSWQKRSNSTYLTWFQRRNWVASKIELTLIFNLSYVCHDINIFWPVFFCCKVLIALLNRIQPILERLKENITKPWIPSIIDRSKWCWHWLSFKFMRLIVLNVHDVKNQCINE